MLPMTEVREAPVSDSVLVMGCPYRKPDPLTPASGSLSKAQRQSEPPPHGNSIHLQRC